MAQRQVGFDDERRKSSYDSYRPSEPRGRHRSDRGRERLDEARNNQNADAMSLKHREGLHTDRTQELDPRLRELSPLETGTSNLNAPLGPRNPTSSSANNSPGVGRAGAVTASNTSMRSSGESFPESSSHPIVTVAKCISSTRASDVKHLCCS